MPSFLSSVDEGNEPVRETRSKEKLPQKVGDSSRIGAVYYPAPAWKGFFTKETPSMRWVYRFDKITRTRVLLPCFSTRSGEHSRACLANQPPTWGYVRKDYSERMEMCDFKRLGGAAAQIREMRDIPSYLL